MSFDPISIGASVLSIVGNLKAGESAKAAGLQQQAEANNAAAQMRVNAGQALAAAQRDAYEERRQGTLVQSRAMALLAASGGSVTDPTAIHLLANNAGETAYRSAVALYKGEDESRQLLTQADATQASGRAAAETGRDVQKSYNFRAFGDLLQGGNSLYEKYGTQQPAPVRTATPRIIR